MRWTYRNPRDYWKLKFAWFPTVIGNKKVWLEFYERQYISYRRYRRRLYEVHIDNTDYGD